MKIRTVVFMVIASMVVAASQAFAGWSTPVPVTVANSQYDEWYPSMTDGLHLYFSRLYTNTSQYGRIFMASRPNDDADFNLAQEVLSGSGHLIVGWVSPDNLRMYYHNELSSGWYIKVSERASVNAPWPQGKTLSELNSVSYRLTCPRLTPDELTIVFVSRQADGSNTDLYMATRANRSEAFGNIHPLTEVNTFFHDNAPSLTGDGLTLYFISNRNGLNQIFRATRYSALEQFGNIELMPFDDPDYGMGGPCISPDGKTLCFARSYGTAKPDIYVSYFNSSPLANAGDDQHVYAGLDGMAAVTLDGSDSNDPENDVLTYTWSYTIDGQAYEANGVKPTLKLPVGTHTITLVVSDAEYDSETDSVLVEVIGPLKVDMKLSPVLHWQSFKLLTADLNFPQHLDEQIDPYSIALAADPNVKADYCDLHVYHDSILRCNVGFANVPVSLVKSNATTKIFGCFRSGRLFYGEDKVRVVPFGSQK